MVTFCDFGGCYGWPCIARCFWCIGDQCCRCMGSVPATRPSNLAETKDDVQLLWYLLWYLEISLATPMLSQHWDPRTAITTLMLTNFLKAKLVSLESCVPIFDPWRLHDTERTGQINRCVLEAVRWRTVWTRFQFRAIFGYYILIQYTI